MLAMSGLARLPRLAGPACLLPRSGPSLRQSAQRICCTPRSCPHIWEPSREEPRRGQFKLQAAQATAEADAVDYLHEEKVDTPEGIPNPIIKIDNQSDRYHTVVSIQFGDRLGELLDTIASLKKLGLSIRKAKIKPGSKSAVHQFLVTDSHTAEKVLKSARLEEMRFTILSNLLYYHPEAGQKLGGKRGQGSKQPLPRIPTDQPLGARRLSTYNTKVTVQDSDEGGFSEMQITTADRPGLLTDIVKVLKDISVNVISAEVDTEGPIAKDHFLVSYHGDPLNSSMRMLVTNALQYYLGRTDDLTEESY